MPSVKKNFVYNMAYQALTFLTPLITTPYLSRVMGAEKLGIYSYSYSVAYYFVLFAMLGLNNYGNREIAKVREDKAIRSKTFWSIYAMQLFMASITIACYIIFCLFIDNEIMSWIMLLYVCSGALDINWFFWGLEEFKITVVRNSAIKLLTVVGILTLVKSQDDLYIYGLLMAGSMLLSPLILWPYLKRRVVWYKPTREEIVHHIRPNLILFVPVIAVSLYKYMDKIMLGTMSTKSEVGYYDYSERVIAIPISVVNALGTVMLPRMSSLVAKHDTKNELSMIHNSIIFGVGLASALSFGLMAVANVFVPFFYGAGYDKCVTLFYVLLPSSLFMAAANVLRTQYLIPHGMDKEFTFSVISGAFVNLIFNSLLIPHYESVGAATGTLIAESTVCVYQMITVRKELPIKEYIRDLIYITFASVVMYVVVYIIPNVGTALITLIIKVLVGVVVYFILILPKYRTLVRTMIPKRLINKT